MCSSSNRSEVVLESMYHSLLWYLLSAHSETHGVRNPKQMKLRLSAYKIDFVSSRHSFFTVTTTVVRPCTVIEKVKNEVSGPFVRYSIRNLWNLHVCCSYNYCSTTYRPASLYHIKMCTLTQCDVVRHFPALSLDKKSHPGARETENSKSS